MRFRADNTVRGTQVFLSCHPVAIIVTEEGSLRHHLPPIYCGKTESLDFCTGGPLWVEEESFGPPYDRGQKTGFECRVWRPLALRRMLKIKPE